MIDVIDATNLLGDGLYTLSPIREYKKLGKHIVVVTSPGILFDIFREEISDIPVYDSLDKAVLPLQCGSESFTVKKLGAGDSAELGFKSARDTGRQLHISEGYAAMLGFELPSDKIKIELKYQPRETVGFGVAPFSRSCSRHTGEKPNKTLDDWKWNNIIAYLRKQGSVTVFGGPKDHLEQCAVADNEYFSAKTYSELRDKLLSLKLFVTVDNGLGHLASALNVPTVLLWPPVTCVGFIAPLWAPRTELVQMEPNSVTPAGILCALREITRKVLGYEPQKKDNGSRKS